ncbi:unnamed protein product [Adineta ricciae]|uniref:G-protein coupled receptors family 1 profile domain-containing protein n=1 Tax=Adineta ricciae TaxID=249248 RepID=A0A813R8W1_ADIRI|nr:unnamed protein product [Adineta ricciae]CAF1182896.1 unnamed protein product [Adineta ricciae]
MTSNWTNNTELECLNDNDSSQLFAPVKLRFSPGITLLIWAIYSVPFCFGVFGNVSVCLIFFQQKKLRSITNTFLMNLCINDLIVLCVSIPMTLSSAVFEHWISGGFLCKFVHSTPTLTALISTFTVAVIAVERWLFIVNKRKFDRRCTIIILILLWTVSILIALPDFISRSIDIVLMPASQYPTTSTNSSETFTHKPLCRSITVYFCVLIPNLGTRIFSYLVITVQYLVPFLFVSISCYSISRFLKRRMKQMRVYQTYRPTSSVSRTTNPSGSIRRKKYSHKEQTDEPTEHESFSGDELPVTIVTTSHKSIHLLSRFRNKSQTRDSYQDSVVVDDQTSRSSSNAGTILMPTVKSQSHSERRFHRSKKLLICVAAVFTISWLPLTIVQIYVDQLSSGKSEDLVTIYSYLICAYLISSLPAWINPVIYNYVNRSFRREFYALYPCCCRVTSSSSPSLPSTVATSFAKTAPTVCSRAELSTVVSNKLERQQLNDIDEETSVVEPYRTNRSSIRLVTFADVEKKGKSSLTIINEHT